MEYWHIHDAFIGPLYPNYLSGRPAQTHGLRLGGGLGGQQAGLRAHASRRVEKKPSRTLLGPTAELEFPASGSIKKHVGAIRRPGFLEFADWVGRPRCILAPSRSYPHSDA